MESSVATDTPGPIGKDDLTRFFTQFFNGNQLDANAAEVERLASAVLEKMDAAEGARLRVMAREIPEICRSRLRTPTF